MGAFMNGYIMPIDAACNDPINKIKEEKMFIAKNMNRFDDGELEDLLGYLAKRRKVCKQKIEYYPKAKAWIERGNKLDVHMFLAINWYKGMKDENGKKVKPEMLYLNACKNHSEKAKDLIKVIDELVKYFKANGNTTNKGYDNDEKVEYA